MDVICVNEKNLVPKSASEPWHVLKTSITDSGDNIIYTDSPQLGSAGLMWNVQFRNKEKERVWHWFKENSIPIIIGEASALKRKNLWRISLNNIDNTGLYGIYDDNIDWDRPKKIGVELEPWRLASQRGKNILICIQNDTAAHWPYVHNGNDWLISTVKQIRNYTNRHIIVRLHPRINPVINFNHIKDRNTSVEYPRDKSFIKSLDDAWCVINPSSNPGVEAAIKGIPVFTAPNSLAFPVANSNFSQIESPKTPDRWEWLVNLSHKEWSVEEISNQIPYKRLRNVILSND